MQYQYLAPLKTWFRWMSREHHILANPAADLDLPRQPKRLPRSVPSVQEVEAILAEAEPDHPQGLRDRALLGNPLRHRAAPHGAGRHRRL